MRIWNDNHYLFSHLGVEDFEVFAGPTLEAMTSRGTFTLEPGTGLADYTGQDLPVDFPGVRYVMFDILTNPDGAVFDGTGTVDGTDGRFLTGLSEVRFEGTPLPDAVFGAELTATEVLAQPGELALNEVSGADDGAFWLEIANLSGQDFDLAGLVLTGSAGQRFLLPSETVVGGGFATPLTDPLDASIDPFIYTYYFETEFILTQDELNGLDSLLLEHVVDDGAVFYLNGQEITEARLNMSPGTPNYLTTASAGAEAVATGPLAVGSGALVAGTNRLSAEVHQRIIDSSDVVFAVRLQSTKQIGPGTPGTPFVENPQEWIELLNRSDSATIPLDGWTLDDAVEFVFPAGTQLGPGEFLVVAKDPVAVAADYGLAGVLGPYSGRLANDNDRIALSDAAGNPADEVHYYDGGRWPRFADGDGSSLELRDPDADNAVAESWAAGDESAGAEWHTYSYSGIAQADAVPIRWNEFVMGLFGAGQVLLDDVEVIEDPDGTPVGKLPNGDFEADTVGDPPSRWRMPGNHRLSVVDEDPDVPGNKVLRLVSTGQTNDRSNHAEITFIDNLPAENGTKFEIRFRAKWIEGASRLNTRFFFNRLPASTQLIVPEFGGTPGAPNSRSEANAGPTMDRLRHEPVVPDPGEEVVVSVTADDPDGVAALTLHYSVNSGEFITPPVTMAHQGNGVYTASIPAQPAGAVVQFFVTATDSLGRAATFPDAGEGSRVLYAVEDNRAADGPLHSFRIVMTPDDTALCITNQ